MRRDTNHNTQNDMNSPAAGRAPGFLPALVTVALLALGTATPAAATIINILGAADIFTASGTETYGIGPYATYADFPASLEFRNPAGAGWTITPAGGGFSFNFDTLFATNSGLVVMQFEVASDAALTGLDNLDLFTTDGPLAVGNLLLPTELYFVSVNFAANGVGFFTLTGSTPVPEPATLPLTALGLLALGRAASRRRRSR